MEMTSLNITLPEPLKVLIEIESEEGGYATASDYNRALIREAEQRKSAEAVESLLLEGLDPNDCAAMSDAEWEATQAATPRPTPRRVASRDCRWRPFLNWVPLATRLNVVCGVTPPGPTSFYISRSLKALKLSK